MEAVVREAGGTAAAYHRCAAAPYPSNGGAAAPGGAAAGTRAEAASGGAGHGANTGGRRGPRLLTWRLDSAPRAVGGADLNVGCDMRDLQHNINAK